MRYQIGWAELPVFEPEMAGNELNLQSIFCQSLDPCIETLYGAKLEGA